MSEMNHAALWFPPQFPVSGRLPRRPEQVQENIKRQSQLERDYQNAASIEAGRRVEPPCCKTLHITLCFDGTGNNLNNDLYESGDTPHPTNIARLFRASIGTGYVGGTAHAPQAHRLTDAEGTGNGQYYKYYMPGVGTPFPEVGDLDYNTPGLAMAFYGEERVNWGLMMIIDALRRALAQPRLDNVALMAAVKAMGVVPGLGWVNGERVRRREFDKQLRALAKPLRLAMTPRGGQCQLLGLKLYVYGFSRGAAAARAFVSWLNGLLSKAITNPVPSLVCLDMKLPISVEYLGLLDTVASVGLANMLPGLEGHMGWADSNQQLPDGALVKRCLHIVASHEQRLCFPLDSIRHEAGDYPSNSVEVLHPGVHSDQGGGYPPGEQGKAVSQDARVGDGLLLSQIALHDLYSDAFAHGAPLKVPVLSLPILRSHEPWRVMDPESEKEFIAAPELIARFNAWREVTLGLPPLPEPLPKEQADHYVPLPANETLEQALRTQMAWITAWRIDRYAFASLKQTPFYLLASDTQADPARRASANDERDSKHAAIVKQRKVQHANERSGRAPARPMPPGYRDFDPDMAQTQLREAAEEFLADYRLGGFTTVVVEKFTPSPLARRAIAQLNEETRVERERMKADGQARVSQLFPPPPGELNHQSDSRRGNVDESANFKRPEGLLRALFDDQVHDSRAWFLYAAQLIVGGGREPFGSYMRDRMVFFGETNSRKLAVYDEDGQLIVAGDPRLACFESTQPTSPGGMEAERTAEAQKSIAARWDAHYAQADEVKDAPV